MNTKTPMCQSCTENAASQECKSCTENAASQYTPFYKKTVVVMTIDKSNQLIFQRPRFFHGLPTLLVV